MQLEILISTLLINLDTKSSEVPKDKMHAHPVYLIFCALFLLVAKVLLSNLQSAIFG